MIPSREINDSRYFLMIDAIINKHIPGFLHAPGGTAIFAVENNKRKKRWLMFRRWIEESEYDGKNDFFDNSVMSVRQWLAVMGVMMVPVLNVVMMFWWALADKELVPSNKVNWARAAVIMLAAMMAVVSIAAVVIILLWYTNE